MLIDQTLVSSLSCDRIAVRQIATHTIDTLAKVQVKTSKFCG